jgi:hypothetical protein
MKSRRAAWLLFTVEVLALGAWAVHVDRADPPAVVSGEWSGDVRFGFGEAERRRMFQELVRGEPDERQKVESQSESAIWNRNRDSWFHQREHSRLDGVAATLSLASWQAYLILDEGFKKHWPPPPGVTVYADDAPLARTARPLAARRVIVSAP